MGCDSLQSSLIVKDKKFYATTLRLAVPVAVQTLFLVIVNWVNSLMMSEFGIVEMSAVSQASQIFYIYSVLTNGFASPLAVLLAQYWGKKDTKAYKTVFATSLRWVSMFGLIMGAAVLAVPGGVMRIMSSDFAVIELGIKYLTIAAFSFLPYAVTNTIYSHARATGRVTIIFISNALTYGLMLVFNYVLIFGKLGLPALGVVGVAVGTLLARLVEVVFMLMWFLRVNKDVKFGVKDIKLRNGLLAKDYVRVAAPIMGHELVWSFGISMSQVIMGQIGTEAITAYNIAYLLNQLLSSLSYGLSGAALIVVGNTIGSGEIERAKRESRTYMLLATGVGVLILSAMLALSGSFISLYSNLTPRTIEYARQIMIIMSVVLFFMAWEASSLVGVLRAGGDGKTGFIVDLIVMWGICIPLGLLAAFRWELSPILVILIIKMDMPVKSIVGLVRTLRMRWIKNLTRDEF